MEQIDQILQQTYEWIWGLPLLLLLLGTGAYLTIMMRGMQFSYLGYAIRETFKKDTSDDSEGDISHFESLMTSLAGAIGTGTIVGVATAIAIGGLGAIFWMWVAAIFGMATKYAESLLAVKYRVVGKNNEIMGGPMMYIERGMGWKWMAVLFSMFGCVAAMGTGNLVQINAVVEGLNHLVTVDPLYSGIALSLLTAAVIIGGVKSIARVSSILVPLMALLYVGGGLLIILLNIDRVPDALYTIFRSAFFVDAAAGGFLGAGIIVTIQMGVSRSIFCNEAGLGIPTIAAAAAKTDSPCRQALITMTGALTSTALVCTVTALVLAVSGVLDQEGLTAGSMAIQAFGSTLWGGTYLVSIGLILFAYSTVVAWAYYGEKCFEYLLGERSVICYRILFSLLVIPGAILKLETVWIVANIANGLMVIPNLIALIALSGVVVAETNQFVQSMQQQKARQPQGVAQAEIQ